MPCFPISPLNSTQYIYVSEDIQISNIISTKKSVLKMIISQLKISNNVIKTQFCRIIRIKECISNQSNSPRETNRLHTSSICKADHPKLSNHSYQHSDTCETTDMSTIFNIFNCFFEKNLFSRLLER